MDTKEKIAVSKMIQGDLSLFMQWARITIQIDPSDNSMDKIIINDLGGTQAMIDLAAKTQG
jgi:hypothetical protein